MTPVTNFLVIDGSIIFARRMKSSPSGAKTTVIRNGDKYCSPSVTPANMINKIGTRMTSMQRHAMNTNGNASSLLVVLFISGSLTMYPARCAGKQKTGDSHPFFRPRTGGVLIVRP